MAEYLSDNDRFFLPRMLRFNQSFLADINVVIDFLITEIIDRSAKDLRAAQSFNTSVAFFLRDLLALMNRTFVLRQIKNYNDLMVKKIK